MSEKHQSAQMFINRLVHNKQLVPMYSAILSREKHIWNLVRFRKIEGSGKHIREGYPGQKHKHVLSHTDPSLS